MEKVSIPGPYGRENRTLRSYHHVITTGHLRRKCLFLLAVVVATVESAGFVVPSVVA